jgi:hypothetical protein
MSHNQHEDLRMCNDACFQDFNSINPTSALVYMVTANQKYAERQKSKNQKTISKETLDVSATPFGALKKELINDDAKKAAEMVAKKRDDLKEMVILRENAQQDPNLDAFNKCRDLCVHVSCTSINLARNLREITCNQGNMQLRSA